MFEKCNPSHPDKICDRIGGAIVDLGYKKESNPKIAGECLLGHGNCHIIIETSVNYERKEIEDIVHRIAGSDVRVDLMMVPQDKQLSDNQSAEIRCGDNGIFKGVKMSDEEMDLANIVYDIYKLYPFDGKYIIDESSIIACQSNIEKKKLETLLHLSGCNNAICNPIGDWTGGTDVDTGACNRKLGSDMGRGATGGGLHFKDISKADVAINVYLHYLMNETDLSKNNNIHLESYCSIGDDLVYINIVSDNGKQINEFARPYKEITDKALEYIKKLGGFEKMGEWGLVMPNSVYRLTRAIWHK